MKYLVFIVFLASNFCFADYTYNLSVCALFQNEAPYLKEWIEYHKLLGVEHFYLYNNNSEDNYLEILTPYIQKGVVELKDEPTVASTIQIYYPMQCRLYTQCADAAKGISKWVAFIDIDEFLVPVKAENLTHFLKAYEKFGGVGVNWRIFGTSYVKKIPDDKLLIETLTACTDTSYTSNRYIKCIVQPERVAVFNNAHMPEFKTGYFGVNTSKYPLEGPMSDYIVGDKMVINHYWTRDEHFFYNIKVPRHKKWGGNADPELVFQKMNLQKNELILRFVPELRAAMSRTEEGVFH